MTKRDLVNELAKKVGSTQRETSKMVDALCDIVCEELSRGETVKLNGFGCFQLRRRAPRKGRNPTTGEEMPVPATTVVTFKPSSKLTDAVAGTEAEG